MATVPSRPKRREAWGSWLSSNVSNGGYICADDAFRTTFQISLAWPVVLVVQLLQVIEKRVSFVECKKKMSQNKSIRVLPPCEEGSPAQLVIWGGFTLLGFSYIMLHYKDSSAISTSQTIRKHAIGC